MSDDIIEIKPGIGPFKLNIVALIRKLRQKSKNDLASMIGDRFLSLFIEHGISLFQIQRFIPKLTPDKLKSTDSLLPELTSDVLESAATLFGVQLSWLEGAEDRIYAPLFCYKQPHLFFEEYFTLNLPDNGFAIRALSTTKKLDGKKDLFQPLALVLVEKVKNLSNEEITRYRVFSDGWDWSHPPCRIQLKAMTRLALLTFGDPIPLHIVKQKELEEITKGKLIPHSFLKEGLITNPSFEDFALSDEESAVSKETEELPKVLDYIESHKLDKMAQLGS